MSVTGVMGQTVTLSFTPSISPQPQIQNYNAWGQSPTTLLKNNWIWLGQCSSSQSNINFSASQLPSNPAYITATANGTNGTQSAYAAPILFDTNSFVETVTNYAPLLPPSGLHPTIPTITNIITLP
jgi:hypothetical protein